MAKVNVGLQAGKPVKFELNKLTKHAAVVGTTGSGKTVMCKILMEECLARGIPVIAIDPKGDIGGLGIADKHFDFRPFVSEGRAKKLALSYVDAPVDLALKLEKVKTTIYTPKSDIGKRVALMPDLSAPKKTDNIGELADAASDSLLSLANTKGQVEKYQSFLSTLIVQAWEKKKDLTIASLIALVQEPPISDVGELSLDEFVNEKERKKLAASLNVLLTSPSKKAWAQGEPLQVESLLKKGKLSIFDIRSAHSSEEKRFVVEQILLALYKHLISQGGTERLRYVLYIDELAGIIPPPPASPPIKRLLELLIRQARAFGLGIILATQSPGDVDYKLFGNVGTRFIGKLRTHNDVEKIAVASDFSVAELKEKVGRLQTGGFIMNDAISNKTTNLQARWLATYHGGPLKQKEIAWINDPNSRPKREGKLTPTKTAAKRPTGKKSKRLISTKELLKQKKSSSATRTREKSGIVDQSPKVFAKLTREVKKYADTTQLKVAAVQTTQYTPHLRIVVEPKKYKGVELPLQGPWVFDLTSKAIPIGNYLAGSTFRTMVPEEFSLEPPRRSIKQAFDYARKEAKRELITTFYESTILKLVDEDKDEVANGNYQHLLKLAKSTNRRLDSELAKKRADIREKTKKNRKKIADLRRKLTAKKAKRMIGRTIAKRKLSSKTAEMKGFEKRVNQLRKENDRHRKRLTELREQYAKKKQDVLDKAYHKAHTTIRKRKYRPTDKDLVMHATILLVPRRVSRQ